MSREEQLRELVKTLYEQADVLDGGTKIRTCSVHASARADAFRQIAKELKDILAQPGETAAPLEQWLLKLMLRISTDCALTALEDPFKYGDGWVLHSAPVLQDIAEAARMAKKVLATAEEVKP